MANRFQFDAQLTANGPDLRVTYEVTPYVAATYWQPAEGGEVEIVSIKQDGREVTLSPDEEEAILQQAMDRADEDWFADKVDDDDWHYEEYRDRLMMKQWEREA